MGKGVTLGINGLGEASGVVVLIGGGEVVGIGVIGCGVAGVTGVAGVDAVGMR